MKFSSNARVKTVKFTSQETLVYFFDLLEILYTFCHKIKLHSYAHILKILRHIFLPCSMKTFLKCVYCDEDVPFNFNLTWKQEGQEY